MHCCDIAADDVNAVEPGRANTCVLSCRSTACSAHPASFARTEHAPARPPSVCREGAHVESIQRGRGREGAHVESIQRGGGDGRTTLCSRIARADMQISRRNGFSHRTTSARSRLQPPECAQNGAGLPGVLRRDAGVEKGVLGATSCAHGMPYGHAPTPGLHELRRRRDTPARRRCALRRSRVVAKPALVPRQRISRRSHQCSANAGRSDLKDLLGAVVVLTPKANAAPNRTVAPSTETALLGRGGRQLRRADGAP